MNLNLGVVAFFQETKLERLLDLLTGAWRCPCGSTASPAWDRGLRTVSYSVTSHTDTLPLTAGLGSLLGRLLQSIFTNVFLQIFDNLSFLTALPTVALPWLASACFDNIHREPAGKSLMAAISTF